MVVYGTRTVQLARRRDGPLGFSVRGGREHGTGVFISQVEPASDAQLHGLKVGDEVLQVNGLSVKKATHREVVSVIRNSSFVQLRVRDVGLLPVKEYAGSPVAWRTVETIETRIYIGLTGQTTLGCSICKGPPGWPGVFVQSTKEVGLAREVGLRPGDQIIQCNGVSFIDIDFAKAVYVLKLAQHLDLTIRRGVAADLFAARSSGYSSTNCTDCSGTESSNSSVTAGSCSPHPPAGETRPPSIGDREHSAAGGATARRSGRRRSPVDEQKPLNHAVPRVYGELSAGREESRPDLAAGSQLTIDRHRRWQDIEAEWAQSEQEDEEPAAAAPVHLAGSVTRLEIGGTRPPGPPPPPPPPALQRGQGDGISDEMTSTAADQTSEQQECAVPPPPPMMSTSTLIPTYRRPLPLTSDGATSCQEPRVQQHDQLMEEFKQAHKKMFAHKEDEIAATKPERQGGSPPPQSSPPTSGLRRSKPVNVTRPPPALTDREVIIESRSESRQMRQDPPPPPPPPPPPEDEKKADSINIYTTPTLAKLAQTQQPVKVTPPAGSGSVRGSSSAGRTQPGVETESLDSFTLEHPASAVPKPPPTYFDGAPRKRDVLVSIGSYGDNRPAPSRLQFLSGGRHPDSAEEAEGGKFERATNQLQHELVQTLSRSNLRHRTGSVDNLLADGGAATRRTVTDKYGSVLNISDSGADGGPGGGILKNGTTRGSNKSISFGKTTMIGDVPVTVL